VVDHGQGVTPVLVVEGVAREHRRGAELIRALDDVSLTVERGTFTVIVGPSGAGKSTLLHLAGGLDRPTRGRVLLEGRSLADLPERERALVRLRRVGFVFQFFNLLPGLVLWQNIALPLLIDGVSPALARQRAERIAASLGIAHRLHSTASSLSGGEMQRTALARALVNEPAIVLADEPTGNLDRRTGQEVVRLLREAVDRHGRTVVTVTHDPTLAEFADHMIEIVDGRVMADVRSTGPGTAAVPVGSRSEKGSTG
jgi:putative ABC transport system ATP-binding protein